MNKTNKLSFPISWLLIIAIIVSLLSGCSTNNEKTSAEDNTVEQSEQAELPIDQSETTAIVQPTANLKTASMGKSDGVFYEIFVRSFYDSDGDGVGDFKGVTQQLDYLADLGVEGIWLMPINPSPS